MITLNLDKCKTPEARAKRVMGFGLDNGLEIVSYGLAPNPNGFCFESHYKASESVQRVFHNTLETLDKETVEVLRSWI